MCNERSRASLARKEMEEAAAMAPHAEAFALWGRMGCLTSRSTSSVAAAADWIADWLEATDGPFMP